MNERVYESDIYSVNVTLTVMVTGSNSTHARKRVEELLKSRITQYIHPNDTQPNFKVIGVTGGLHFIGEPRRVVHVEGRSERSSEHTEETSKE